MDENLLQGESYRTNKPKINIRNPYPKKTLKTIRDNYGTDGLPSCPPQTKFELDIQLGLAYNINKGIQFNVYIKKNNV